MGEHGAGQQVGDVQRQGRVISIRGSHQVAHLVVNADAEPGLQVEGVDQPAHADKHQVKVVDGRALHYPVHSTGQELPSRSPVKTLCSHQRR